MNAGGLQCSALLKVICDANNLSLRHLPNILSIPFIFWLPALILHYNVHWWPVDVNTRSYTHASGCIRLSLVSVWDVVGCQTSLMLTHSLQHPLDSDGGSLGWWVTNTGLWSRRLSVTISNNESGPYSRLRSVSSTTRPTLGEPWAPSCTSSCSLLIPSARKKQADNTTAGGTVGHFSYSVQVWLWE